jgi:6-phosphogluconolactonase/glucosamine-6-phosphate isomerase/deaminase
MATAQPALLETGPEGSPKLPRISMNLAMILQSHLIILLVKGAEKQAVLKAAKTDQGLPVHALLAQTITPVHIATDQSGK